MPLTSLTLILSPYHVGLHESPLHRSRVSSGPSHLLTSTSLLPTLHSLSLPIHTVTLPAVASTSEGEIGRSFELLRLTSAAVAAARGNASFPIVLAGNCLASVGVFAGLTTDEENEIGCVWFDAHDDYNVPDTVVSGYFDSQGIAMMAGESWRALMATVPGFKPVDLRRVVHVGMRDVNELERARVEGSEMGVVWGGEGDTEKRFVAGLKEEMAKRFRDEEGEKKGVLVHLDVDVLDVSVGKANAFACAGGLGEEDLRACMRAIVERATPLAVTVASFDPFCDGEESAKRVGEAAVEALRVLLEGLKERGLLGLEQ